MDQMMIKENRNLITKLGDNNCITERIIEHFALHNKCNLEMNPELPRMTSREFNYIKRIDLNDYYYKTGLTEQTIHCAICKFDIKANQVFLHTISTGHKYNKLFVQIIQNVTDNRDIDFIVLNINWLQCRCCGTMVINKYPHDLIDTHLREVAHMREKEYCLNDYIIKQYGYSPGQRDLMKPVDILLSNKLDHSRMKLAKVEASKARSKKTKFLPENCNSFRIEPSGSTEGNELRETEELLAYINRLLMEKSGSCRICCEILQDYKNMKTSVTNHNNENKKVEKSQKSTKNKKAQMVKQSPKPQIIGKKYKANTAVFQNIFRPAVQTMNLNVDTKEPKNVPECKEKLKTQKMFPRKKMKKTSREFPIKIYQANDSELPRYSSVKEDVSLLKIKTKNKRGNVNGGKRVTNFSKLMGLPQKKNTKRTKSKNIIKYKVKTSKPRQAYSGKVDSKKEAKLITQEKIRAARDNFVCEICCKSVPNCKYYIHNHMKGAKHSNRILLESNDDLWDGIWQENTIEDKL